MRVYTVHERAWSAGADRDAVLVREGFAWGAFLFGPLWALAHGLVRGFAAWLAAEFALGLAIAFGEPDPPTALALTLGLRLAFGFLGSEVRRAALARAGHVLTGVVAAPDRDAAEYRYLSGPAASARA